MNRLTVKALNWRTGEDIECGRVKIVCDLLQDHEVDALMITTTPNYDEIGGSSQEVLRAGGERALLEEMEEKYETEGPKWYGLNIVTSPGPSGKLKCKHLIHTVGPVYCQLEPYVANGHLHNCVWEGLNRAHEMGLKSIAMPCLCTGMYGAGFPK